MELYDPWILDPSRFPDFLENEKISPKFSDRSFFVDVRTACLCRKASFSFPVQRNPRQIHATRLASLKIAKAEKSPRAQIAKCKIEGLENAEIAENRQTIAEKIAEKIIKIAAFPRFQNMQHFQDAKATQTHQIHANFGNFFPVVSLCAQPWYA